MNKKRIVQLCCAALVASGIGLNIQNAIAGYGIGENSLSLVATGGSGSGSSGSSSGSSSGGPGGPLGPNETYMVVPNTTCYGVNVHERETGTTSEVKEDGTVVKLRVIEITRDIYYKICYKTKRVKKYEATFYDTSHVPYVQTCSDLGLNDLPVPPGLDKPEIQFRP